MSRRERPAPRLAESAPRPSRGPAALAAQPAPASPDLTWEKLFHGVSPVPRQELHALARSQGMLYSLELPAPNRAIPDLLGQALAGRVDGNAPVCPQPVTLADTELDAAQREAVARALATPDLCLIQGMPGTGKSRVIVEIIAQITARGQRVLFVAPSSAAIDRVLESLESAKTICGLRCLGPDESLESLAAKVRPFACTAQERLLRTQSIARARARVQESECRRERLRSLGPVWQRLGDLANQLKLVSDREASLAQRRAQMATLVSAEIADPAAEAPAGSHGQKARELRRRHAQAMADLEKTIAESRQRLDEISARLREAEARSAQLEPLVNARKRWRFWTATWWRAWLHSGLWQEWNAAADLRLDLQKEIDRLLGNINSLEKEQQQTSDAHQARQTELLDAEVQRRQQLLDEELNRLTQERAAFLPAWQSAVAELDAEHCSPAECTPAAVGAAREAWRALSEQEARAASLARQWADHLEKFPQAISTHLPLYLNMVAAPLSGLAADKHFGEAGCNGTNSPGWFDYLLVDEAEHVTEADLVKLARRSRRWILIGQPAAGFGEVQASDTTAGQTPAGGAASAVRTPLALPFHRLWQRFHCDPRTLPYRWTMEQDRLCCKMRPVRQDQLPFLETERVADSPDIELRILTLPQCEPCLAEIIFPPAFTIVAAKQFIYRELQELTPEPDSCAFHHLEFDDRLAVTLGRRSGPQEQVVPIEVGIREVVYPVRETGWRTSRIEFDRQTGWHWERVVQWFAQRTGSRDSGRTAYLDVLHRMEPGLVEFTQTLFGLAMPKRTEEPAEAAVEFAPVPAASGGTHYGRDNHGARSTAGSPAAFSLAHLSTRGGAGLELDVGDPRQRDRLPADLRGTLPRQGCVNYAEAQAIVEALLAQHSNYPSNGFVGEHHDTPPTVAVVTLYPAQAELVRRLVARAPALADGRLKIEIAAGFPQREADLVLLSLTRSHTHRAVAYGADPGALLVALTRAREKLIIFGDAGTLLRRSQWDGPLEHLDQAAAREERQLISRWVRYLDDAMLQRRSMQVRQGSNS
jgi:hypothetical protein